jgi:hypothetical protein
MYKQLFDTDIRITEALWVINSTWEVSTGDAIQRCDGSTRVGKMTVEWLRVSGKSCSLVHEPEIEIGIMIGETYVCFVRGGQGSRSLPSAFQSHRSTTKEPCKAWWLVCKSMSCLA